MSRTDLPDPTPSTGIIWAFRFTPDGRGEPLRNEAVDAALASPGEGWIWVHLGLADMRCRNWIAAHAPVSPFARDLLAGPDDLMRLHILGDEIAGVVPDLRQEFARPGEELVRLRFVMTKHMLITARQRPVHAVEVNRRAIESGKRFPTALAFFDAVIDQFVDAVAHMAEQLGGELDKAEDHILHEDFYDDRRNLGRVRLQAVRTHRQLAQLHSVFHRVEPQLAGLHAPVAETIRGLAQKLDTIDQEVTSLHERARLLLDEMAARTAEIANRRLFTLSILTACLLPPTLVTGFFGMNTRDLPWQHTSGGTWLALLVALASAALSYWLLRRMRAF